MSRHRKLPPAAARFIRKAFRLRARLTNKALAHKFGVASHTITDYGRSQHKDRSA
jgi:hypothetical protein